MARPKKINIRYFLNKGLKSSFINEEEVYPVYFQLTYNRENNKFPFYVLNTVARMSEENFNDKFAERNNLEFNGFVEKFERKIRTIVREQAELLGDSFSLRGLADTLYDDSLSIKGYMSTENGCFCKITFDLKSDKGDFMKMCLGELRWVERPTGNGGTVVKLQQKYEDGFGQPFWMDVPLVKQNTPNDTVEAKKSTWAP